MLTSGQVTASGSASTLCLVPPGPCTVILANSGTATAWVGFLTGGGTQTASNSFPLSTSGYPVSFPGYAGGHGGTLSVITASGSTSVGFIVSRG